MNLFHILSLLERSKIGRVKKIYLQLLVKKLGDKASLLALHSDSVLEGGERDKHICLGGYCHHLADR